MIAVVLYSASPLDPGTVAVAAAALFPLAAWTGFAARSCEDAVQEPISASTLGSATAVRVVKSGVAAALVLLVALPATAVMVLAWSLGAATVVLVLAARAPSAAAVAPAALSTVVVVVVLVGASLLTPTG